MIYPLKPTQKLTVNVSYPHVGIITFADDTTLMYAASNEPGGPVAVAYADNWMQSESGSVFFSNEDTLMRNDSTPVEVLTGITINATSTTFSNMPKGIKSIQMDAALLDFTLAGISAIESASGRSLALTGFANEAEAFTDPNVTYMALREAMEQCRFTMSTDTDIMILEGRSNRQALSWTPNKTANLPLLDGKLDTSDPRFERFEIISGEDSMISSADDSRMRRGNQLVAELGSLKVDSLSGVEISVVAFIYGDDKGIVLTTSEKVALAKASVVKSRYRGSVM